jgi:hypothetical protein
VGEEERGTLKWLDHYGFKENIVLAEGPVKLCIKEYAVRFLLRFMSNDWRLILRYFVYYGCTL